jgi:hypothetical protein
MTKYKLEFDRGFYLNDPTFENRPLRSIEPELIEFSDDPEDLAAELAYTRYYLAKEEAKNAELVTVLKDAAKWLEDDRWDEEYIHENWYHDALAVLPEVYWRGEEDGH